MTVEKGLLMHWWHYYGKCIYTLEELEKFEKIIDEYGADKVLDFAVTSYIISDGSPTILLGSIRNGVVEEMFQSLPDIETFDKVAKKEFIEIKEVFLKAITETYNQVNVD